MYNYIKFQRGSVEAYNKLKEQNKIDNDTLYFIYNKDEDKGTLYLGKRIISSGEFEVDNKELNNILEAIKGANRMSVLAHNAYGDWEAVPMPTFKYNYLNLPFNSVNDDEFSVFNNILSINSIKMNKIDGLQNRLDEKANTKDVGDLSNLNDRLSDNSSLVDEINNIKQNITWKKM